MSVYHGNDGSVYISAAALLKVKSWTYNETVETADATSMGDTGKTWLAGVTDGSGSITCLLDHDDSTGQDALQAAVDGSTSVTLNLYPAGNTSTRKKLSGTAIISGIDRTGDMSAVPEITFNFMNKLTQTDIS